MKKWLAFILLAFPAISFGQGVRYDNIAIRGGTAPLQSVSNAVITVCTSTGTGLPCTPTATTYTDATLNTPCAVSKPVVLAGTSTCVAGADNQGNYGFWVAPGKYVVTITAVGIPGYSTTLTLACEPTSACTVTGPITVSGTGTFTGATTLGNGNSFSAVTFSNHNNLYWAGPGATPTIDQAKAQCTSLALSGCIIHISPAYTGPEATSCVANSTGYFADQSSPNVVIHDYRALTPLSRCFYGFVVGGRSFGMLTKLGSTGFWTGTLTDSVGAQSNINFVTNATLPSNGGAMNGSVNVVLGTDSVTVGTSNSPWVGSDGECDIQATSYDNPVYNCEGTNGQANIVRSNGTQNIINAIGQHAAQNSNVSTAGAQMINSYGTLNELQIAGVGRNYSEFNRGNVLQDTETQIHSLINSASQAITAATESAQTVTITTSGVCAFTTNQEVNITGVTPAAYNGRYFVKTPGCNGGNTFTYFHPTSASLGAGTVFGAVVGYTPQTTTYFRNTNLIQHNPLSDSQGWQWQTIAGSLVFRIIPSSVITSAIAHEFSGKAFWDETTAPSAGAATDACYGDSTAHALKCSYNNGSFLPIPQVIASGTKALNTASVTTATCDAGVAATATGTASTDTVDWSFNAAPTATNKYGAFLVVYAVPSANTVTFYTCNPSATTSTPTAMTVNWSVRRP